MAEYNPLHEHHHFIEPDSIQILGARGDTGSIYRADVQFSDRDGRSWYFTVETSDEYLTDTIRAAQDPELYGVAGNNTSVVKEPPVFVWNGGELNETKIKALVSDSTLELLMPFLIEVENDSEAHG
jgi:hypothetical protein